MLALVPILGLAIDGSFLYATKAKLSAATDASALATARQTPQAPTARSRAQAYFLANFPPGFLNTSEPRVRVDIDRSGPDASTVRVTVDIEAPTFFLGAIGWHETTIQATSVASASGGAVRLIG